MRKTSLLALVLLLSSSSETYGYCVYNASESSAIHAKARGPEGLAAEIVPGRYACCSPQMEKGCHLGVVEIHLVSRSEIGCTAPTEEYSWVVATVTEVEGKTSILCETLSPPPSAKAQREGRKRVVPKLKSEGLDDIYFTIECDCFNPPPPEWCQHTGCIPCSGSKCELANCYFMCGV